MRGYVLSFVVNEIFTFKHLVMKYNKEQKYLELR